MDEQRLGPRDQSPQRHIPQDQGAPRTALGRDYGEMADAYEHTQMDRIPRLVAVHAGLGTPSTSAMLADRLVEATRAALESQAHLATTEVIALRPLAAEIALAGVGGPISEGLQAAIDSLSSADGVIAVSPVFQGSYTGLFKGFFDVIPDGALCDAPVLMGVTAGTARHSLVTEMALRPLFTYLKARPTTLAVFAASEDFGAAWAEGSDGDGAHREAPLADRVARAGAELAELMTRLSRQAPVDALADFTPMTDLLPGRPRGGEASRGGGDAGGAGPAA